MAKLSEEEQAKLLPYAWKQTLKDLSLSFILPKGTKSKDLKVAIQKTKLSVKHETVNVSGDLHGEVLVDDSTWTLLPVSDGVQLEIHLEKSGKSKDTWWPHVLTSEPEVDTSKIVPENSKLSDLDGETRAMVEKMMVEQRMKQQGIDPEKQRQQEMLAKFQAQHPEMDFSQMKQSQ